MCRYAVKKYKSHLVCFKCHKTFKQIPFADLFWRDRKNELYKIVGNKHKDLQRTIDRFWYYLPQKEKDAVVKMQDDYAHKLESKRFKCPECGQTIADLGLDFKAPRKTAVKQWKIIESMYKMGHCWHTCGCNGPGFIPKEKYQYIDYLKDILKTFTTYLHSNQKTNDTEEDDKERKYRIKYWGNKILLVEKELKQTIASA